MGSARTLLAAMIVAAGAVGFAVGGQAGAQTACGPAWRQETVLAGRGELENLAPDEHGGVYFGELAKGVHHVDAQGRVREIAPADVQATGMQLSGTALYVLGALGPQGGALWKIDTVTGVRTRVVTGLAGPNGLLRLPDGDFLMTRPGFGDQAGPPTGIARFHPGDRTAREWAPPLFSDGIALSEDHRAIYTSNIVTGQILRVPLDDPRHWTVVARLPGILPGPDDLAVTKRGDILATGHVDGNIYRINARTGQTCVIASGLGLGWVGPSSVRIGPDGRGWVLWLTDFDGTLRRLRPPP
ncbi:MAG: hypothetical protein HOQ24_04255 [Mycobacteriaceae bacterium]|nr:hypothetical protein [Mycobacteriaceae bacterium]